MNYQDFLRLIILEEFLKLLRELEIKEKSPSVHICKICPVCCVSNINILEEKTEKIRNQLLKNSELLKEVMSVFEKHIKTDSNEILLLIPIVLNKPFFKTDILELARSGFVVDEKSIKTIIENLL